MAIKGVILLFMWLKSLSVKRTGINPKTRGADKGYDARDFVKDLRQRKVTPHIAANTERKGGSAIDGRTTRRGGYTVSQRIRKWVEEIFGWLKTVGGFRRTRFKGWDRAELQALLAGTALSLLRIAKLLTRRLQRHEE